MLVDHQDPFEGGFSGLTCPSVDLCVGLDRSKVITSSNPTGGADAWTVTNVDGFGHDSPGLAGVSCPSDSLCVAVDGNSHMLATSTNPTGGASSWVVTKVDNSNAFRTGGVGFTGVSCPSIDLCVAVDSGGNVVTSRNPTGGPTGWKVVHVDGPIVCIRGEGSPPCGLQGGISCPSVSLCVALDGVGNVVTSRNPTGGAAAWTVNHVSGANFLGTVYCPGVSLCLALGGGFIPVQQLLTATKPDGGAAAWKVTDFAEKLVPEDLDTGNPGSSLTDISCLSAELCFVIDDEGNLFSSASPAGGIGAWTSTSSGVSLSGLSCPTSTFCVALDDSGGDVVVSNNPLGGAAAWSVSARDVDRESDLQDISCPSADLCVGVDSFGTIVVSESPAAGPSAWHVAKLGTNESQGGWSVQCPSVSLCLVLDGNDIIVSTNPGAGNLAWGNTTHVDGDWIGNLACLNVSFCIAASGGDVVTTTNPTGGPTAWKRTRLIGGDNSLTGVSCSTITMCVALDNRGYVFASHNPTGGATTWKRVASIPSRDFGPGMLSCPSIQLCVAVGQYGGIAEGNPTTQTTWRSTPIGDDYWLMDLTCPGVHLCVAVGNGGMLVTSVDPGAARWTTTHAPGTDFLMSVSCPSVSFCVAADNSGKVIIGTVPSE